MRPQVKVGRRKAGGRHDGGHLEAGIAQGVEKAAVFRQAQQGNEQDSAQGHAVVKAHFLVFEGLEAFAPQQMKVDDEVRTKQQHEDHDNRINPHAVIGPD